jgi:hypothetical protein
MIHYSTTHGCLEKSPLLNCRSWKEYCTTFERGDRRCEGNKTQHLPQERNCWRRQLRHQKVFFVLPSVINYSPTTCPMVVAAWVLMSTTSSFYTFSRCYVISSHIVIIVIQDIFFISSRPYRRRKRVIDSDIIFLSSVKKNSLHTTTVRCQIDIDSHNININIIVIIIFNFLKSWCFIPQPEPFVAEPKLADHLLRLLPRQK